MKKYIFLLLNIFFSCTEAPNMPLDHVLKNDNAAIKKVMNSVEDYELQILYSEIGQDENGEALITDHSFQLNSKNYFYPASTVKMPVAILAMEFAERTSFISYDSEYVISRDSLSHTIGDDIREIFAVSDNEAFNRLYELLGRDYINKELRRRKVGDVRIAHRLSTKNSDAIEREVPLFMGRFRMAGIKDGSIEPIPSVVNQAKGIGFMRNDSLISEPMDFSEKNYFPLGTQHTIMKRLFLPEAFPKGEQFYFKNNAEDYLKTAMGALPRNAGFKESEFSDSYGKFFIYGDSKERIPDHVKIYNIVGYAYGTLTETAYIVDTKNDVKFILSATLLVNKNGIFNDDTYEYEEIGIPFLSELGRQIYAYELSKK